MRNLKLFASVALVSTFLGTGCTFETETAVEASEQVSQELLDTGPLDMVVIVSRGLSMTNPASQEVTYTRWQAVREAMNDFMGSSRVRSRRTRVGIHFFDLTGGFLPNIDCVASEYEDPGEYIGVDAASVSDAAQRASILSAIDNTVLGGERTTLPALQGAHTYAKAWNQSHEREMAVVLVTDGLSSTLCGGDTPEALAAAAAAAVSGTPRVLTYIVDMDQSTAPTYEPVAQAGGTENVFVPNAERPRSTLATFLVNRAL